MVFEIVICCGAIFGIAAIIALFYLFTVYNGLVELRNNIEKAWANIDVLLKLRSDLIPNLVETVKGYMKHERSTLESVTRLRAQVLAYDSRAKKAEASEAISSALKSIFAVSENYPELKASENFSQLQVQLSAVENQIADRREFYNHSVLIYNTRIHSVPDTIFANLFGFRAKEYFKVAETDKKPVEVKFQDKEPEAKEEKG